MAVGAEELRTRFDEHHPTTRQASGMDAIRVTCLRLALLIDDTAPDSREKSDALTNLEYVMYQANAAIARRS